MSKAKTTAAPAPVQAPNAIAQIAASVTNAVAPVPTVTQAVRSARTGLVSVVVLGAKPYRTTAVHNVAWWQAIQAALATGPQPVAALTMLQTTSGTVPGHFVRYSLQNGYLAPAPVAAA